MSEARSFIASDIEAQHKLLALRCECDAHLGESERVGARIGALESEAATLREENRRLREELRYVLEVLRGGYDDVDQVTLTLDYGIAGQAIAAIESVLAAGGSQ